MKKPWYISLEAGNKVRMSANTATVEHKTGGESQHNNNNSRTINKC